MGIASLVLGIISFIIAVTILLAPLGVILAVIGLILGIVDTVKKGKAGKKKAISIVGLVICAILFVVLVVESITVGLGVLVSSSGIIQKASSSANYNEIADDLDSVALSIFNSALEIYEGEQTGSSVKSLLSYISSSNSSDYEHTVIAYYNNSQKDLTSIRNEIDSLGSYEVRFSKDFDGYIYKVYITSKSSTVNSGNNTIDPNSIVSNTDTSNTITNNTFNNTTSSSGTNNTSTASNVGKTSTKLSPLSINDLGIASRYVGGEYIDIPVRVTKVTRGASAVQEVKAYCDSSSTIYKYTEPKEGMEWAVIEYDMDLRNISTNTSTYLDSRIEGSGNNTSIKYKDVTYIVSTMNMSTRDYTSGKIVSSKFAVQLPIGCSDYTIVLGSSSSTQAFFAGK